MSTGKPFFCIIGRGDIPIFETYFGTTVKYGAYADEIVAFSIQGCLDILDQKIGSSNAQYLKNIDKFGDMIISAFVTVGHAKFLLLHSPRLDDSSIRNFLAGVHELYVKALMNPFCEVHLNLNSVHFDDKVKELANKY